MEPGNRTKSESRRIALLIQYDGTGYNGWQIQNKGRTVQEELEKALSILTREDIRVTASGRTDSGVHALGQVVHFDTYAGIGLERLCIGLNGILPRDVSVLNAFHVSNDFHARFSAVEREYTYLIYNHPLRSPFMIFRAMWVRDKLDIDYLKKTSSFLVGEKDFASFCKKISSKNGTTRRINAIDICQNGSFIEIIIRGNAFLHNMIRIITGTLVEMHSNNLDPRFILEILDRKNRDFGGTTAPPYGLYFKRITFDPPLSQFESAFPIDYQDNG